MIRSQKSHSALSAIFITALTQGSDHPQQVTISLAAQISYNKDEKVGNERDESNARQNFKRFLITFSKAQRFSITKFAAPTIFLCL